MKKYSALAACAALLAATLSCRRPPAPEVTRVAFLTFENLTGDGSLDWIGQAAPRVLEHDLTGVDKTIPLAAPVLRDAYLEGASRLVHGYYEMRSGKLHFEIDIEDAASHRMLSTSGQDGQPGEAMNRAAKLIAAGASDFHASSDAVAAWGMGDYERAVMLDPGFALAWLNWTEQLASGGDKTRALEVAQRGLEQSPAASSEAARAAEIDRTQLELAAAALRQDDAAHLQAERRLSQLIPYDPAIRVALAEAENKARDFAAAAHDYQLAHQGAPHDADLLNSLGYAQALAGDLDAARKSFQEYGRGAGEASVNAFDSLGEALFINGKFDDAEQQFLNAYQKDPNFLQGLTLWKAAHARWLASPQDPRNLAAADKIAERYFVARAEAHDPLMPLVNAQWLYETGRTKEAEEFLMHQSAAATVAAAKQQLAVWNQPESFIPDLAKLEQAYQRSNPVNDGLARVLYADALLRVGRKDQARELLKRWPLPDREESPLQSLVYPKFLELRKQLG